MTQKTFRIIFAAVAMASVAAAQPRIPKTLGDQFSYDSNGVLHLSKNGQSQTMLGTTDKYVLTDMITPATGAETGIQLDFGKSDLNGTVAWGPYMEDAQYPMITYNPRPVPLEKGRALLPLKTVFVGAADFFHFSETGRGVVGFRVIDAVGRLLYEGRVAFTGKGPYQVVPTIIEGPLVNLLTPTGTVVSFETSVPVKTSITVDGKSFGNGAATTHHEIAVTGLKADTAYKYEIAYGDRKDAHNFRTAVPEGSRKPFTFGFTADTRAVTGGGENDLGAVDYKDTRAAMAVAMQSKAAFMVAMGGNTTGNNNSTDGHMLEHANWKRALEPFWSHIPVYAGMGNHEGNYMAFTPDSTTKKGGRIARFPYETESGEAAWAKSFVLPTNGPESEGPDFPTYKENVYYYTYGNLAMVVLNSEYWKSADKQVNGAPEGYVMDEQMKWLEQTLKKLEADPKVEHIFVNLHSCVFPSGDHADAGMWFNGSNDPRPMVAGVRAAKGIIERRDELIDMAINHGKKVVGFLVGSEHNITYLKVTPTLDIYPKDWTLPKLKINREFAYVNSGAGGTYAYALLDTTPWHKQFQYFTAPPALTLFTVNGPSISMKIVNPATLEVIADNIKLK